MVREESSGGGYGDPLERGLDRVTRDLRLGYLDARQAEARYGVVLDGAGEIDAGRTEARRAELSDARVRLILETANEDVFEGPRRYYRLPAAVARRLGVTEGQMIELRLARGPGLRGWVELDEAADGEAIALGPAGMAMLGAAPGDAVEVRAVAKSPVV